MRVQRRIYWTLPVLGLLAAVLIFLVTQTDPERTHSAAGWLGGDAYYPRWIVYDSDRVMMWLTGLADCAIAAGCGLISYSFWNHRRDQVHFNPESIILFTFMFLSVGLTHLVVTLTFVSGVYLLDLLVRSSAAAMCLVTSAFVSKSLLSRSDEGN